MAKDVKALESSAFAGAHNQARREQSVFRAMLTTYKSPKTSTTAEAKPTSTASRITTTKGDEG